MNQDIQLGEVDSVIIRTAEGSVWVSTLIGTQVAIYDNPDENPVATFNIRKEGL